MVNPSIIININKIHLNDLIKYNCTNDFQNLLLFYKILLHFKYNNIFLKRCEW